MAVKASGQRVPGSGLYDISVDSATLIYLYVFVELSHSVISGRVCLETRHCSILRSYTHGPNSVDRWSLPLPSKPQDQRPIAERLFAPREMDTPQANNSRWTSFPPVWLRLRGVLIDRD